MLELLDAALGPAEAALGVPQVGHDESVLPGAVRGARAAQVAGRRRAVVHAAEPVDGFGCSVGSLRLHEPVVGQESVGF